MLSENEAQHGAKGCMVTEKKDGLCPMTETIFDEGCMYVFLFGLFPFNTAK